MDLRNVATQTQKRLNIIVPRTIDLGHVEQVRANSRVRRGRFACNAGDVLRRWWDGDLGRSVMGVGCHKLTVGEIGRTADCQQHNCKREHLQFQCSCPSRLSVSQLRRTSPRLGWTDSKFRVLHFEINLTIFFGQASFCNLSTVRFVERQGSTPVASRSELARACRY